MRTYPPADDLLAPVLRVAMPRRPRLVAPGGTVHIVSRCNNRAFYFILGAAPVVAPLVALILLAPAPVAAFRQWRERRLLDKQDGLASIRALSWASL